MRVHRKYQLVGVLLLFLGCLETIFQPIAAAPAPQRIDIRYPLPQDVDQLLKNKQKKEGAQDVADKALDNVSGALPTVRSREIAVSIRVSTRDEARKIEKRVREALKKEFNEIPDDVSGFEEKLPDRPISVIGPLGVYRPRHHIRLGLDLRGGSHLVLQLRHALFVYRFPREIGKTQQERDAFSARVRTLLTNSGIGELEVDVPEKKNDTIRVRTQVATDDEYQQQRSRILEVLRTMDRQVQEAQQPQFYALKKERGVDPLEQSRQIIQNRVDALGVGEVTILKSEPDRIIVELPGIKDPQEALRAIRETALLEFRLVPPKYTPEQPPGAPFVTFKDNATGQIVPSSKVFDEAGPLKNEADPSDSGLTGKDLVPNAYASKNDTGENTVNLQLESRGKAIFARVTSQNVGKHLGIFLDRDCISAPVIREPIAGGRVQISGGFENAKEAQRLALLLNAGALPVPIDIVENRTVSATLGEDSVKSSLNAGIIAVFVIVTFMIVYYGLPGVLADFALMIYCAFNLASLVFLGATLTLPGIAGFILAVGMSVDTNILVFERLKEEMQTDKTFRAALQAAFDRAWTAILDSHVTTLIAATVLYYFGTGAVKGFALTLSIGVLSSLFTAFTITRVFVYSAADTSLGKRESWWRPIAVRIKRGRLAPVSP